MKVKINNNDYEIIKDLGETIELVNLDEIVTDYYYDFDYIVGDWAYNKVRLKGFYKHNNKNCKEYNDYNKVNEYIENNCAYGCKYFILEKLSTNVEKEK